jgi:hypothetical protein
MLWTLPESYVVERAVYDPQNHLWMLWVCDGSSIDHAGVFDLGLAVRIPEWIRLGRHHGSTLTPNHGIRDMVCLFTHTVAQLGQTPADPIHIANSLKPPSLAENLCCRVRQAPLPHPTSSSGLQG